MDSTLDAQIAQVIGGPVAVDDAELLFISPAIHDWSQVTGRGIDVVIDLEGDLDIGVPTVPNEILYVYFPIHDAELPDLDKLHAVVRLGTRLVRHGHHVLSHCGMGFNRSALVAGLIMIELGLAGPAAVAQIRSRRPGALFNPTFASYLESLPAGYAG